MLESAEAVCARTELAQRCVVGELAVEDVLRSFCGELNIGGIEDADVPSGGVSAMAEVGRDSRSTFSARAVMRFAIP